MTIKLKIPMVRRLWFPGTGMQWSWADQRVSSAEHLWFEDNRRAPEETGRQKPGKIRV
jgi:hypothetical protein